MTMPLRTALCAALVAFALAAAAVASSPPRATSARRRVPRADRQHRAGLQPPVADRAGGLPDAGHAADQPGVDLPEEVVVLRAAAVEGFGQRRRRPGARSPCR